MAPHARLTSTEAGSAKLFLMSKSQALPLGFGAHVNQVNGISDPSQVRFFTEYLQGGTASGSAHIRPMVPHASCFIQRYLHLSSHPWQLTAPLIIKRILVAQPLRPLISVTTPCVIPCRSPQIYLTITTDLCFGCARSYWHGEACSPCPIDLPCTIVLKDTCNLDVFHAPPLS